jgi:NAD(P)-dependent dehydrogenase (short-subunit alcohol dehydrogenase family)
LDFANRHVVVTGGTGALGSSVVARLIAAGATCHVPNFDAAELSRFPLANDRRVTIANGIDLADEDSVVRFYGALPSLWASIHIAGGFAMKPVAETSASDFRHMMRMNALTCFLCCREAAKRIRAAGAGGGRIVNVAARPGIEPRHGAGMTSYAASKAAVAALTQALAEELAPEGIWVNAIVPATLDTPANRASMPKADFAKWARLEDVAEVAAFLASPDNRVTRGGLIPVYGRS